MTLTPVARFLSIALAFLLSATNTVHAEPPARPPVAPPTAATSAAPAASPGPAPAASTSPAPAALPPAPTADEIQRVTAYYLHGAAAGPVLIGLQLCAEIGKNAEGKLDCSVPLPPSIKKGDKVSAFVRFFAPRGGKYDDVRVRFLHDGVVRSTSDMSVTESWTGYGNYKTTTATKAGTWEAQVLRGEVVLDRRSVKVE